MRRKKFTLLRWWLALGVAALPVGQAVAEEVAPRGFIKGRHATGIDGSEGQLSELLAELEFSGSLSPAASFKVIGRARYDALDYLEPGELEDQGDYRSGWNRRMSVSDNADVELREAYLDLYAGEWFFRLGKQQVVWGQADGLRVLDQVNPLSYREFILGDFDERRIPLWMVNAERPVGDVTVQLLWVLDQTYDELPTEGVFAFTASQFRPQLPDDVTSVTLTAVERPDGAFSDSNAGVRVTGFSGGWDWSLNALYAYRSSPVIYRERHGQGGYTLEPTYSRSTLVGGSASNAFGSWTLRTEMGLQSKLPVLVNDPADTDGIVETPEVRGVVGLDYQVDADTLLSGQLFVSTLVDAVADARRDRTTETASFLLRREFMNDTVQVEGLLLHSIDRGDGLAQLSAKYRFSDAINLRAGIDFFYGDEEGLYGQFDKLDRVSVSVEYGF